jgi:hypothetical protein
VQIVNIRWPAEGSSKAQSLQFTVECIDPRRSMLLKAKKCV